MKLSTLLGLAAVTACSTEGSTTHASSAIAYGAIDTVHTSVVAVIGDQQGSAYTECTGTIVQVKNGNAYVLTAAHCCNGDSQSTPTRVVAALDYANYVGQLDAAATPPAYTIAFESIWYDAAFDVGTGAHDFCMLQVPALTGAAIALPSGADGMASGSLIDFVGFGSTDTDANNTKRRLGAGSLSTVDATTLGFPLGSTHPGPCSGDSGGPVLSPSGAAQTSQTLVGVVSTPGSQCGANGTGIASRITSAVGTGGFISSYLADAPIGTHLGGPIDAGTDAATTPDASTDAAVASDAAPEASASGGDAAPDAGAPTSGGGGCTAYGSSSRTGSSTWLLALVALVVLRARRAAQT